MSTKCRYQSSSSHLHRAGCRAFTSTQKAQAWKECCSCFWKHDRRAHQGIWTFLCEWECGIHRWLWSSLYHYRGSSSCLLSSSTVARFHSRDHQPCVGESLCMDHQHQSSLHQRILRWLLDHQVSFASSKSNHRSTLWRSSHILRILLSGPPCLILQIVWPCGGQDWRIFCCQFPY